MCKQLICVSGSSFNSACTETGASSWFNDWWHRILHLLQLSSYCGTSPSTCSSIFWLRRFSSRDSRCTRTSPLRLLRGVVWFRTLTAEIPAEKPNESQQQTWCTWLKAAAGRVWANAVSVLTIFGDANAPLLCGPMFKLVHTGQVLPLVRFQRKLISQPGFHSMPFKFWLQGCLTFDIFRNNPGEVGPDILGGALTHRQPEVGVGLSHHRHAQLGGFWKRRTCDREAMSSCGRLCVTQNHVRPDVLCTATYIVLFSGSSRLGCSNVQVRFWPAYRAVKNRTELRTETKLLSRTSVSVRPLRTSPSSPTCQVRAAAGATLSAEQYAVVYLAPSLQAVLEATVTLGRAVLEPEGAGSERRLWPLVRQRRPSLEHTAKRECYASVFWLLKRWVIYHTHCGELPRQAGREA